MDKKYRTTLTIVKIFWAVLVGTALVNMVFFDSAKDSVLIIIARYWVVIFMFVFAFISIRSCNYILNRSPQKMLYTILWGLLGFISIFLLTIPTIVQNNKVRSKEMMGGKR